MFRLHAVESGSHIILSGFNKIHYNRFVSDIRSVWKYRIIEEKIFLDKRFNSVAIEKFFAIELSYMINIILKQGNHRSNKSTLNTIQKSLSSETWMSAINNAVDRKFDYSKLNQLKVKLLPPQMEFLKQYAYTTPRYNLNGWMLNAAPGTGKTLAGYAFSLVSGADVTIIVSPKNAIKTVWEKTLINFFNKNKKYWISSNTAKPIMGNEDYIICHYEALDYVLGAIPRIRGKQVAVWLDESHNLNDIGSQRTQKFIKLCKSVNAKDVIWASGTPIKAIGKESIPLMYTIDPLFNDNCEETYAKIFAKNRSNALDILAHRMGIVTFTVEKSEVVENKKIETTNYISIPNASTYTLPSIQTDILEFIKERTLHYREHMPEYAQQFQECLQKYRVKNPGNSKDFDTYIAHVKKMHVSFNFREDLERISFCKKFERTDIIPSLSNEDKHIFRKASSIYKYVVLTIKGEALGRILTKRRIECLLDMVSYAGLPDIINASEKKTIIFTSYVSVADAIDKYLSDNGFKPIVIYGKSNKNLPIHMKRFSTDPSADPIIATYDSLSTAVPVTDANTCILFNLPFRDYIKQQATSRIDRLGQDSVVRIVEILLDTGEVMNISTRSNEILQWSQEQVNRILGVDSESDKLINTSSLDNL